MTTTTQTRPEHTIVNGSPRRGAFNAWFFDHFDGYINFIAGRHKRAAFDGIEPGTILEIGAGTGANFTYLPGGSQVIALEPNDAMHDRLGRRASKHSIALTLVASPAEAIPLQDNSVDTVICTLVLCTVSDPVAVLSEIRRVLRPGGTFRFVEHVGASRKSPRKWLQRLLTRPWAWIFEGCQLCRPTGSTIEAAGFTSLEMKPRRFRLSLFVPVNSAIYGTATN